MASTDGSFSEKMQRLASETSTRLPLEGYIKQNFRPGRVSGISCPWCGSGTHEDGTGAVHVLPDDIHGYCPVCEKRFDIFDAVGVVEGIEGKADQYRRVCELAGVECDLKGGSSCEATSSSVEPGRAEPTTPRSESTAVKPATVASDGGTGGARRYSYEIRLRDGAVREGATLADVTVAKRRRLDEEHSSWIYMDGTYEEWCGGETGRYELASDPDTGEPYTDEPWELTDAALAVWKAQEPAGASSAGSQASTAGSAPEGAPPRPQRSEGTDEGRTKHAALVRRARADLFDPSCPQGLDYMHSLGFTDEELREYGIGWDRSAGRVVYPWSAADDEFRHIDRILPGRDGRKYLMASSSEVGSKDVYHADALDAGPDSVVFVVEGIKNAMAIEICGGRAIACTGTATAGAYWEIIDRGFKGTIAALLDFDPDEDGKPVKGRKHNAELVGQLEKAGVSVIAPEGLPYGVKDAAEVIERGEEGRAELRSFISEVEERAAYEREHAEELKAEKERAERRERLAAVHVLDTSEAFAKVRDLAEPADPIPTGLTSLDVILDGGLYPGNLVVLGADSSFGKTTLALQVADNIATTGHPVLFVTGEQSAAELMRKSLSRLMWSLTGGVNRGIEVPTRDINRPAMRERWDDRTRDAYEQAVEWYESMVLPGIRFLEPAGRPSVADIKTAFDLVTEDAGEPPVLFIDYLQILAPIDERDTDRATIDKNMTLLRQLVRDSRAPCLAVSSVNRQSYSGDFGIEAYKESGGIEYASDVLLGLQPVGIADEAATDEGVSSAEVARRKKEVRRARRLKRLEVTMVKQREGWGSSSQPVSFFCRAAAFASGEVHRFDMAEGDDA